MKCKKKITQIEKKCMSFSNPTKIHLRTHVTPHQTRSSHSIGLHRLVCPSNRLDDWIRSLFHTSFFCVCTNAVGQTHIQTHLVQDNLARNSLAINDSANHRRTPFNHSLSFTLSHHRKAIRGADSALNRIVVVRNFST